MKKRFTIFALSTLLLASFLASEGAAVLSQNPPPPQDDKPPQLKTFEVRLPVTVKQKGKFLGGLAQSNFEIFEDGKKQKIDLFIAPSELPLNVGLLMDTSNSVKLKLPVLKEAADAFVATVTSYRRKDKVLVASFDSDVELHEDFTESQESLYRAIKKLKAGGYTKMFDAVYRVIEEKMATSGATSDVRRILVVLSDGADTASERTLKESIELAQKHDVTVFGISTKNFSGTGAGTVEGEEDKDLRRLCEETGGQVFLPSQLIALHKAFTEVAQDIRQEYVLYYKPDKQDPTGKPRRIEVKLLNTKGEANYKRGYTY